MPVPALSPTLPRPRGAASARLAEIRRDLVADGEAEPRRFRVGIVGGLMLDGQWEDPAVRAVVWERPDADTIIKAAKAWLKGEETHG